MARSVRAARAPTPSGCRRGRSDPSRRRLPIGTAPAYAKEETLRRARHLPKHIGGALQVEGGRDGPPVRRDLKL